MICLTPLVNILILKICKGNIIITKISNTDVIIIIIVIIIIPAFENLIIIYCCCCCCLSSLLRTVALIFISIKSNRFSFHNLAHSY